MSKPKISLAVHTASPDDFLKDQGIPSAAACLIDCLKRQEFKEFELIYVDAHFASNKDTVAALVSDFVVKHVGIHPAHRYWYDQDHIYIAAAKNTGLLYADGELLISCDDAELFPSHFLKSYWYYYANEGRYLHAAHRRFRTIKTEGGKPVYPLDGDLYINDTRNFDGEVLRHAAGGWLYAGTSASLEHALAVNGFNERMDGTKGAEDCEFGTRLELTGGKFILDRNVWLGIIDHPHYMDRNGQTYLIVIENYSMICCARELDGFTRANLPNQIDNRALEIIKRETLKYRKWDPLAPDRANDLKKWMGTPSFDLRQQRNELRRSTEWKW